MKVIVKKPKLAPEICEVQGMSEINKLTGNLDENGKPYSDTNGDTCNSIGNNVNLYCYEFGNLFGDCERFRDPNVDITKNLWISNGNSLLGGTIVFAGYNSEQPKVECGACSLTEEQIKYALDYIEKNACK